MMNKDPQSSVFSSRSRGAFEIALLYLLIGILWIVFSDEAAATLAPNQAALTQISIYKGWGYVLVTALLLYWMIGLYTKRLSRAEWTLGESEKNYQELLQQASDGIFIADDQGQYTFVNEEACRLLGYTKEELLSMNLRELIAPEDIQKTPPRLDELKNGKTLLSERILLRKDGSRIVCEISAKLLKDGSYQSIVRDITERKVTDEALLRSEQRYRSLFENMTNGFARCQMLYDENGAPKDFIYLDVNQAFENLTGLKNVLGKHVSTVIPGIRDSNPELFEIYGRVALTGKPEKFETYVLGLRSGIWFSTSVYSTEKNFFVTVFEVITERKQAEAALRENEERLRLSLHAANQGLYDLNVQTGNAIVNREYAEMLGYDFDSFVETNAAWIERLHPDDQEITENAYADYIKGLTPEYRVEFRQRTKAGDWKWILSLGKVAEYDSAGKPLRMLGTHTDVTARKQAELDLKDMLVNLEGAEEQARLGSWYFDTHTNKGWWSKQMYGLFELDPANGVPSNDDYLKMIHPEDRELLATTLMQMTQGIPPEKHDFRIIPKPGVMRTLSPYYQLKKDQTGQVIKFSGTVLDVTERKQAEEKLKASEFRFRLAAESLTDVIYEWDIKEKVDWFGDVDALMGYAPGTFPRTLTGWAALLHPDDQERVLAAIDTQLKGGASYNIEYRVATKRGEWRWWSARGIAIRDLQGRPYHWIGSISDITERMQKNEALKKSEAKYRTLHESMIDGFVSVDVQGNFLECNEVYRNMLGYSDAELAGLTYVDITPENWHAYETDIVENQVLKRGFSDVYEKEYRRKDGTIFPVELHTVLLRDEAGTPSGMWAIVRDITERRQNEEAIKESEEKFRNVFEYSPLGKSLTSLDGNLRVNKSFCRIVGYSEEELKTKNWKEITHPDDIQESMDVIQSLLDNKTSNAHFEKRYIHKNGKLVWTEVVTALQRDKNGKPLYFLTTINDITERKQAENELRDQAALLDLANDAIIVRNMESKIMFWNRGAEQTYGWMNAEAVGQVTHDFLHTVFPVSLEAVDQALLMESLWEGELTHTRRDGEQIIVASRQVLQRNKQDQPTGILEINRDITERKQADAKLRESEERFSKVFHASPMGINIFSLSNNRSFDVNEAFLKIIGYSRDEVVGHSAAELNLLVDPEARTVWMKALRERNGVWNQDTRVRQKSGEIRDTLTSIDVIDVNGEPMGLVAALDITERKRADLALQAAEYKYRMLAENSPDIIYIIDLKTFKTVYLNRPTLLGYTLDELEASGSIMAKVHPDDMVAVQRHWQDMLKGTGKESVEYRLQRKDGSWEWLNSRENLLAQDENGIPAQVLVTLSVITERKQTETIRTQLAAIVESSEDAIIGKTLEGVVTSWNSGAERLYGYVAEEIIGQPISLLIPSDRQDELPKILAQLKRGESIKHFETERQRKDSTRLFVSLTISPIGDALGQITGASTIARDITERKRAEEAVRESQALFLKAFRANPAAMVITRLADGTIIDLNASYEQIFEYSRDELIGKTSVQTNIMVDPKERNVIVKKLQADGHVYGYETTLRAKSGRLINALFSIEMIEQAGEQCMLSIMYDITERKHAENELKRSNAELEQFAYVASHDLQEPLRAVAGMVQLLGQRYQGKLDERADEYIGHAVEASTRMQKLINDLLDYSRVNRLGRSFENTAVERSLNNAIANLQLVIQESQAQITHDPLPTLMADSGQLTQVLQNLIGNAIKFRGARPLHIHLGAKKMEQAWQFSVSDNGIGIEPKYYERIFLVFQRLHTRREYPGTGIGLALCKKIIERHNGQIWVESQPGLGSTFYFTIPERQA